jgi:hypothetical protein
MVDERIKDSIREAVEMQNQPEAVADKIIKWFENVSEGNESIDDKDDYRRRLDNLFSALDVEENGIDI